MLEAGMATRGLLLLAWEQMEEAEPRMAKHAERPGMHGEAGETAPTVCIREGEQTEEMASGILLKTLMRGHRWLESAV